MPKPNIFCEKNSFSEMKTERRVLSDFFLYNIKENKTKNHDVRESEQTVDAVSVITSGHESALHKLQTFASSIERGLK